MTKQQMNNTSHTPYLRTIEQNDLPQPLALLLFTQRLAALKEANLGMARAFDILQDAPAPYGTGAKHLKREIEQGFAICEAMSQQEREKHKDDWWHPQSLFKSMGKQPELFSRIYIELMHAGETAGAVDEIFRRIHTAIAREWKLLSDHPAGERFMFLTRPANLPRLEDWPDLNAYQQMVTLSLFFETFSMLLFSGVALLPAMDTVSALLPMKQSVEFLHVCQEIAAGAPLLAIPVAQLDFIPRYA